MRPNWNLPPEEIERLSFETIDREIGEHSWDPASWEVVRRMIHTSGDLDLVDLVEIHPEAIETGIEAMGAGRPIFTDTNMARVGMVRRRLDPLGVETRCLMLDPATAELAKSKGTTRAVAAVDMALPDLDGAIYAIGNAPTALFRLLEHIESGRADPALIIGTPVGFVNAAESKQALMECGRPFITIRGRKGGSALAAAAVNALAELYAKGR
jgi:precorrin-8X/cobalt-precorrin-8 methylmutase